MEIPCACSSSMRTYKPGYTAPQRPHSGGISIDISGNWGSQLDLDGPRVIAMAAEKHCLLEAEYDEYTTGNSSGATCCRSIALILLLRTTGFLLPCYIMARAMNILQNRRQRQDALMTVAEVAFLMQASRARGLRFAGVASAS